MARNKAFKNITVNPSQGGALIGSASDDVPITQEANYLSSSANYTEKLNFRRETDGELRREGWDLFRPKGVETVQTTWGNTKFFDAIDAQYPIRAVHQFPGSDGAAVLIAIGGQKVWRLEATGGTYAEDPNDPDAQYAVDDLGRDYWLPKDDDFLWKEIYNFDSNMDAVQADGTLIAPSEGGAYRWEVVTVQNHVIINNGVDLPVIYRSDWSAAEPLYGLRENGVVSVGTISSYQDRLFCSDITVLTAGFDELFLQTTHDPYSSITIEKYPPNVSAIRTERLQYRMMYSAEGEPRLFNTGIELSADEPLLMESGGIPSILTVTSSGEYGITFSYRFKLNTPGSLYKLFNYGEYQGQEAYTINMITPISDIKLTDESGFTSGIFLAPSGSSYKLVNSIGADMTFINPSTSAALGAGSYSVVLRPYSEQLRAPAAVREFAQDGSRILKMKELADKLVVYRDSGFFFVSKTNNSKFPFSVEARYKGGRIPDFRHTIIDVDGKQHLFMGNSGVYSISRTSTEPQPVSLFEIGPPFWQIVPADLSEFVYSMDNPVTREIFINCPLGYHEDADGNYLDERGDPSNTPKLKWGVIAYDYVNKTLSTIDTSFTSGSFIRKPRTVRKGPDEAWFIMGVHQARGNEYIYPGTQYREDARYGGVLVRYGYGPPGHNERLPYRYYGRLGYGYESRIKSGLIDFGDSFSDKEVRSYVLELSSKYGTTPVRVKLSTSTSPQGTEEVETMSVVDGVNIDYVELNNLVDENMIPLLLRAPYIRDEIIVLPSYDSDGNPTDNPIKLVGRTFEVSGVDSRSVTQAYNQG